VELRTNIPEHLVVPDFATYHHHQENNSTSIALREWRTESGSSIVNNKKENNGIALLGEGNDCCIYHEGCCFLRFL
jgi:hypothetical protein